ncbi:MAG: hypothetical protein JRD39_02705 [Deltaproteobacteria bacterium]|nr:hypothetical protein [Deltaproteobacteria bacterium]
MDGKVMWKKRKPTDIQKVFRASSWLGVSEFQVFCDAWQAWYDEKPSEKRIEPFFIRFLGEDAVPFWVRNYVRGVLDRKDLLQKEKKRLAVGMLTYYVPLLIFFILLMRVLL